MLCNHRPNLEAEAKNIISTCSYVRGGGGGCFIFIVSAGGGGSLLNCDQWIACVV